jgi:hypothetical protein
LKFGSSKHLIAILAFLLYDKRMDSTTGSIELGTRRAVPMVPYRFTHSLGGVEYIFQASHLLTGPVQEPDHRYRFNKGVYHLVKAAES